jgi:hypothetical protein
MVAGAEPRYRPLNFAARTFRRRTKLNTLQTWPDIDDGGKGHEGDIGRRVNQCLEGVGPERPLLAY